MFAVATISESYLYLYLHDLFFFVCVLCIFYVYMGQVPEIKLMMMMMITDIAFSVFFYCITRRFSVFRQTGSSIVHSFQTDWPTRQQGRAGQVQKFRRWSFMPKLHHFDMLWGAERQVVQQVAQHLFWICCRLSIFVDLRCTTLQQIEVSGYWALSDVWPSRRRPEVPDYMGLAGWGRVPGLQPGQ